MSGILIRCDASTAIGSGHVMRCLTLARALEGRRVTFACTEIPDVLAARVIAAGHELVRLPGPRGGQGDLTAFLSLAGSADGVVVDGYAFDAEYRRAVRAVGRPVLALDDTGDVPLYADVVANPSPAALDLPYDSQARLLLGPSYALVAPHLVEWRNSPVVADAPLLVSFGGSDPLELSVPVTRALRRLVPQAPLRVVLGGTVADLPRVARTLADLGARVDVDVRGMGPVLRQCRLALSAAGSTLYELAALARPMVLAVVADNQNAAAHRVHAEGWGICVDARAPGAAEALAEQAARLWGDDGQLRRLGDEAARRVDGSGAGRVAHAFVAGLPPRG